MNSVEPTIVSWFFASQNSMDGEEAAHPKADISDDFLHLIDDLNSRLKHFNVPAQVECIYNSTIYARHTFEMYVRRYCNTKKSIMYFGMNPGPWGMSQTGIPFGEVTAVRDWLKIEGPVGKPEKEIKTRPVKGFECTRSEISGKRFWGLIKDLCGTPEVFFRTSFVYNYLPQQWMKTNGCNVTPNEFKISEMKELYEICDAIFIKVLQLYEVQEIVAIGKFCETRAQKAVQRFLPHKDIKVPSEAPSYQVIINIVESIEIMEFMNRALELANEALQCQEVPVGCVFIVNGKIVAQSRNCVNATRNPTRHAEINCIDTVLRYCSINHVDYKEYFKTVSVYVTVEPCIMCACALNDLCVKEVIFGCANDRFGGKTVLDVSAFYKNSYLLTGNLLADKAMALLKQFYKGSNPLAPEGKKKLK